MNYIKYMFNKGGVLALPRTQNDYKKNFWLATIGIRQDGCEVWSKNLSTNLGDIAWQSREKDEKIRSYQKIFSSHAESRTLQKMNKGGGTLYVVRIAKDMFSNGDFDFRMARPCVLCSALILSKKIERVYYTINNEQYGVWDPQKDLDVIKDL